MSKRLLVALSAIALLGAGCWSDKTDSEWVEPKKPEGVAGAVMGNWKMKSAKLSGQSIKEVADSTFLISFDGTKLNGRICNSMNGEYAVTGIVLKAPMVASTKMFCQGDPGVIETAFLSGLPSGYEVTAGERMLTLKSTDAEFVLTQE